MELIKQLLALNEDQQMTPKQAWMNLLAALDELNEDESKYWTNHRADDEKGIALTKAVMDEGVDFDPDTCMHWMIEMMGSFEVTHSKYKSPDGSYSTAAKKLMNHVYEMVDLEKEFWHHIDEAVSDSVKDKVVAAVKHSINVRFAELHDVSVGGKVIQWNVRYDFPEHGEGIEDEMKKMLKGLGSVSFEMMDPEDVPSGEFVYQGDITLKAEMSDDESDELEHELEALKD